MILDDRIKAFEKLRNILVNIRNHPDFDSLITDAYKNNSWFSEFHILHAFHSLTEMISPLKLRQWILLYPEIKMQKRIGVIIPSNIPLVGFYDFLCVLLTGHVFVGQLASSNLVLLPFVARELCKIDPRFKSFIFFEEKIRNIDFLIFSGNDNSSNIISYHFRDIPCIIRHHRNGIAVLNGKETLEDYQKLAHDIFIYFGFGCRNISKIFIPHSFDFSLLIEVFEKNNYSVNHQDYFDNYHYQKSFLKINNFSFKELSNILLVESNNINSPISVLYYEYYEDVNSIRHRIVDQQDKIQCILSNDMFLQNSIQFGEAQSPSLLQSPDGIDVVHALVCAT
ncbi:acyl-CoA reductase [Flavobacteriales bacterium]|nr:acyl-CoA reductase [Flavobacteriales bacterium]